MVILSASLGAGHDGAARELARRLGDRGYTTRTEDYLACFPLGIGWILRWVYGLQLRRAPWAYEATFRIWYLSPLICRALTLVLSILTSRRLRRMTADPEVVGVVSTYPLQSLVLGRGRRRGWLAAPVTTFITDFGVHPLWIHPGVDLTICVHENSAAVARSATDRAVVATGPMVGPRYQDGPLERAEARRRLGLPESGRLALVVAGSWGVGDIEATFDELYATGRYLPVVVCGNNEELRRRLAAKGYGVVLGWTDRMHELMSASDVLVQNAGGLSCMEAFAVDLPVVTFHPIPGHGRKNAAQMESAGVAVLASGPRDLVAVLDHATGAGREEMVAAGRRIFQGDPAHCVHELVTAHRRTGTPPLGAPRTGVGPRPAPGPARPHRHRRRLAGTAALVAGTYLALNLAADAAVASGLDTARPEAHAREAYVAVRVGPALLSDPAIGAALAADHVTAVVDGSLALADPAAVRRLAHEGVDIATSGWSGPERFHLMRPTDGLIRAQEVLGSAAGVRIRVYAPPSGVSGLDLASAILRHLRIVRPSVVLAPGSALGPLAARRIYILGADRAHPAQLTATLDALRADAARHHLSLAPLSDLR